MGMMEDWYRKAVMEQGMEDNIFPPAMEDREAVDILMHYLLPENWYVTYPASRGQVTAEAVDEILRTYSKKYRKEIRQAKKRK